MVQEPMMLLRLKALYIESEYKFSKLLYITYLYLQKKVQ